MAIDPRAALASHQSYDFRLIAIHSWAISDPEISSVAAALGSTCKAFGDNLYRMRSTFLMISMAIHFACLVERFHAVAESELDQKISPLPSDTLNTTVPIMARVRELYHEFNETERNAYGSTENETAIRHRLDDASNRLAMMSTSPAPQVVNGINGMLSSLVVGMWTTFETMAGDLWEAALNAHPGVLADLAGDRKRLVGRGQRQQVREDSPPNPKQVPLNQLQRHQYDIRNKMGTVLQPKFNFDSLDGIREAYAVAFSKHYSFLDIELKNTAFDSLSALRNVIVHRGGVADEEYKRKASGVTLLPKIAIGEYIMLDGLTVARLLSAAERSASDILRIVDDWIGKY